jgi:hypothetical protein
VADAERRVVSAATYRSPQRRVKKAITKNSWSPHKVHS